ncbi:MAG: hypothetical protein FDZ69_06110 [Deltaproteobacteria bacterium]|nr:MAG: hypothetical protein FDZ69_06110 [Deltaproteobacteria bacterium]
MLALEEWAKDRNFLIAIFSTQIAATAQTLDLPLHEIKAHRLCGIQFAPPNPHAWFKLYRSHRLPTVFLREIFRHLSRLDKSTISTWQDVVDYLPKISKERPRITLTPEATEKALRLRDSLWAENFKDLAADFSPEPLEPAFRDKALSLIDQHGLAASYYFFVLFPCWLHYRIHPTLLYRKARHGDVDAIEKLLRLDALMIHDPYIGKRIQALRFKNKFNTYEELMAAPLKLPKVKASHKRLKMAFAGLISVVAQLTKQPLNEPEIRALFDAAAKDAGRGDIDTDLPPSQEAFSKAIQRERAFWLASVTPDKKI